MRAAFGVHMKAAGQMIVNLPAAVGHGVREGRAVFHIVLGEHHISHIAAAFTLAGQESHPFQIPVFRAVIAVILHMIPYAEGDLEQFVADFLGIVDGILHAAQLDPVEVGVDRLQVVGLVVHGVVIGKIIGPLGRRVGNGVIRFPALQQQAHTHGVPVRFFQPEFLAVLRFRLPAHAVFGACQGRKNAVAGRVHKNVRFHRMPQIRGQLEAPDAYDPAFFAHSVAAGAVEHQIDVFLKAHHFIQQRVPCGKIARGIPVHVFQQQFFHNAGLLQIPHTRTRAGDPHADLAGGVSAQHGPVLHQSHLRAPARGGNRGKHAADSAAYHADIRLVYDGFQGTVHSSSSSKSWRSSSAMVCAR